MAISDDIAKNAFDSLPAWARHSISLTFFGGLLVAAFFLFVREPQAQAAAADQRQDAQMTAQQSQIEKLTDIVASLAQNMAVQTNALTERDHRLDRIEDKIDKLRQGR